MAPGAPWRSQWCGVASLLNCEETLFWLLYGEGVDCRSVGTPAVIHKWKGEEGLCG